MIEDGLRLAKPLMFWFEPQSRMVDVQGFYQRQLGLRLDFAARSVGGALIDEVAITGSDPYFPTGTDVAVLMQSKQSKVLFELIAAQIATAGQMRGALQSKEEIEGSTVVCWKTADRQMSSYIVQLPDAVVVSNSPEQMRQVLRAGAQKRSAMKDLDEYKFFRGRYPRKPDQNKAFVIITDAAIRRWCGPEWRIAAARRTRARAELADLTVEHMDSIVAGNVSGEKAISASTSLPSLGDLFLSSRGVRSARFGTLAFQTPIAEMALKSATQEEVRLYGNWRIDYQRRWRNVFDPIAIEVLVEDEDIHLDLSVIPLILDSSYRQWMELSGTGRLKKERPAKHPESMISSSIAIDVNSEGFAYVRVLLDDIGSADLLNWIDGELTWHVDYDQGWFERLEARSPWAVGESPSLHDVPIGLFIPSCDNVRMAAFVDAVRARIERVVPNLITWKEKSFGDLQYVVGTFKEDAIGRLELPEIYYATIPSGLALSANEQVLLRMVKHRTEQVADRVEGQHENEADAGPNAGPNAEPRPNYELRLSGKGMQWDLWQGWNSGLRWNCRLAWSNIPAMNYLRSRYPDRDPIAVYKLLFGEQLVDPAEGEYLWSDAMQTYESSHYGHHLAPKAGPSVIVDAQPSDVAEASLSFQDGGLRARFQLDRGKDKQ